MSKLILCLAVAAMLVPRCLVAAESALVRFPEGAAAWTVALSFQNAAKPSPDSKQTTRALVQKIDVTQSGEFRRSLIFWTNSKVSEQWHYAALNSSVVQDSKGTVMLVSDYDRTLRYFTTVNYGESRFEWVQPECLKGEVRYQGKQCLYYEGETASSVPPLDMEEDAESAPSLISVRAWVEKETLRPVAYANDEVTALFTFLAPPASPLVPPKAIADEVVRFQKALAPPAFLSRKERRSRIRN